MGSFCEPIEDSPRKPSSSMPISSSDENLRQVLRLIFLLRLLVFDMLIFRLLCFGIKVAEVSLGERGYAVPDELVPHTI